jgi:ketosteroid isomerase-like protein
MDAVRSEPSLFPVMLDAFMAKDVDAALAVFADDAVVIDPHYPEPRMQGRAAIERGFRWGLSSLEKPGFSIRNRAAAGEIEFFECDTRHKLSLGPTIAFDQVFVVETRAGKIIRMQAYEPYPAPGIAGVIRRVSKLIWKLRGWI